MNDQGLAFFQFLRRHETVYVLRCTCGDAFRTLEDAYCHQPTSEQLVKDDGSNDCGGFDVELH